MRNPAIAIAEPMLALLDDLEAEGEQRYRHGEPVFRRGDRAVRMLAVAAGRVELLRFTQEGTKIRLYVAEAGELIAEASLFADRYHCDAVALSEARVEVYSKADVLARLASHPDRLMRLASIMSAQVRDLRTRLELRNIRSARERLRTYLWLLQDDDSCAVVLRDPIVQLAAEIGLAHETVYRVLAAMEADREIIRRGNRIELR